MTEPIPEAPQLRIEQRAVDLAAAREIATVFDFGSDAPAVVHLHDGFSWDIAGTDWTFDFHA